jgi:nucleotide-binding universal stress UspA family protein
METKSKLILWAIDPFDEKVEYSDDLMRSLGDWLRKSGKRIQPVHVLVLSSALAQVEISNDTIQNAIEKAKLAIDRLFNKWNFPREPAKIIFNDTHTIHEGAHAFAEYIQESKPSVVLVSSHARKGLPRFFFGSFAETLLTVSSAPILFLHQNPPAYQTRFEKVLFATDFSEESHLAMRDFIQSQKDCFGEIILFYDVCLPIKATEYLDAKDIGPWLPDNFIESQTKWAHDWGHQWIEEMRGLGFTARMVTRDGIQTAIAPDILKTAAIEEADLIVMSSKGESC